MKTFKNCVVLSVFISLFTIGCSKGDSADNLSLSSITITPVSSVTVTTASTGGNISSDGGAAVTAKGVCWNTAPNPTISNSKTNEGSGIGAFTSNITGLAPNTKYYVRAYATNDIGTAYSSTEEIFTTSQPGSLATVTVVLGFDVGTTFATTGGNVTSDGGSAVTARGVCWNTSRSPTISNPKTTDGSGTGSFASQITGLALNTIYYARAYATNSIGTAYSNEFVFQTSPLHSIGNIEMGGVIFYTDRTGEHGLIAALQDVPIRAPWYNGSYILIGTTSTALGSGQANTTAIVNAQGPGNYAASICDNLVLNGYSDWYLPSKDELNLFYQNRSGTIYIDGYWSSSEVDKDNAWAQTFGNTTIIKSQDKSKELGAIYVRPIRSF